MLEEVLERYEEQLKQRVPLSSTEATDFLRVICAHFSRVYVCLDGVDELTNLVSLLECLKDMPSSMHLFITGRPHVRETVQKYFKKEKSILIQAHKSDIRRCIEPEIGQSNDDEPDTMNKRLKMDIVEKVVDSAKGMLVLLCPLYPQY